MSEPSKITVMTYLEPQGVPRPHLYAGHLTEESCRLCTDGLERNVPEWTTVSFTHHVLHADVSEDLGEIAAFSLVEGRWWTRPAA